MLWYANYKSFFPVNKLASSFIHSIFNKHLLWAGQWGLKNIDAVSMESSELQREFRSKPGEILVGRAPRQREKAYVCSCMEGVWEQDHCQGGEPIARGHMVTDGGMDAGAKMMQNLMNFFKDSECFSKNYGKTVKWIKEDYRRLNDQIWG